MLTKAELLELEEILDRHITMLDVVTASPPEDIAHNAIAKATYELCMRQKRKVLDDIYRKIVKTRAP